MTAMTSKPLSLANRPDDVLSDQKAVLWLSCRLLAGTQSAPTTLNVKYLPMKMLA